MVSVFAGAVSIKAAEVPQTKLYFSLPQENENIPVEPSPNTRDQEIAVPLAIMAISGTVSLLFFQNLKFNI